MFLFLSDRPDAPKDLEICNYDQYSTTLQWKKPDSDGGNPIKGYQVCMFKITNTILTLLSIAPSLFL